MLAGNAKSNAHFDFLPRIMYDWTEEKRELRDQTAEDQRRILAKWVKDIVWEVGCTCREAEKFLTAGLADVLKPGYETF